MVKRRNGSRGPLVNPLSYNKQLNLRVNTPMLKALRRAGNPSMLARGALVQWMLNMKMIRRTDLPE